ncbi:hypothetical protein LTR62_005709 [Meristemomyces frigidus]|uniref:Uncharacterized protein n=1 Tax=Meristemomyces frigidus TaxID=1508187 RepID=A0AAN7TF14_9PEZI|nr:hypothetical protein LTR62_005709 [Meristemomyces frigidus]
MALRIAFPLSLILLMLTAALEMALLSSMVYWLHYTAGGQFDTVYNNTVFSLHGKPVGLLVNQGHTSNGAAGTAFVAVGLGSVLAFWLRGRARQGRQAGLAVGFYYTWLTLVVLSALLAISALVYTFVLTSHHANQNINLGLASTLNNQPYPLEVAYPLLTWTPENWFTAVLELPLLSTQDRRSIHSHLLVMKAWRWNLIPLVVFGVVFAGLAIADAVKWRRERKTYDGKRTFA